MDVTKGKIKLSQSGNVGQQDWRRIRIGRFVSGCGFSRIEKATLTLILALAADQRLKAHFYADLCGTAEAVP